VTAARPPFVTGSLLVASPALTDPHFDRSVVLVVDHDEDGAVGLVLNRPSELRVFALLPVWSDLAAEPQVVFEGGPVAGESALALARVDGIGPDNEPEGARHLTGDLCLVDLDGDPDVLTGRLRGLRVFAGYAGWAPDQLESEIAEGSWFVVPALPDDPFRPDAGQLWRTVLRRQTGALRLLAGFPADPSMN
jgi:putative transcriptional regulator